MPLIEQIIMSGNFADRPAPGVKGRIYNAIDYVQTFMDTGTDWNYFATVPLPPAPPGLTVIPVSSDTSLGGANVLVMLSGTHAITLPDATTCPGQTVIIKSATGDAFSVLNSDSTSADGNGQAPWHGISDGTKFWNVDF